jgi:hypothetical protein
MVSSGSLLSFASSYSSRDMKMDIVVCPAVDVMFGLCVTANTLDAGLRIPMSNTGELMIDVEILDHVSGLPDDEGAMNMFGRKGVVGILDPGGIFRKWFTAAETPRARCSKE